MADLIFKITDTGETIYDPLSVSSDVETDITVTNLSTETASDLGVYIVTSTNLGPVDTPGTLPPESDYQDLLNWGTEAEINTIDGGVLITVDAATTRVTRSIGSTFANRIPIGDLPSGDSIVITVLLETPPDIVTARRMYVDLAVE